MWEFLFCIGLTQVSTLATALYVVRLAELIPALLFAVAAVHFGACIQAMTDKLEEKKDGVISTSRCREKLWQISVSNRCGALLVVALLLETMVLGYLTPAAHSVLQAYVATQLLTLRALVDILPPLVGFSRHMRDS